MTARAVQKGVQLFLASIIVLALFWTTRMNDELLLTVDSSIFGDSKMYIKVFIGIKTQVNGERLLQIQKTWLQDVKQRPEVDLKFFADATIESNNEDFVQSWIVKTPNCGPSLCCKDEIMFKYFLNHYAMSSPFSPWFCSFDDDNYVLVDNLLKLLLSYQRHQNDTLTYVGRASAPGGFLVWPALNDKVYFLNSGAGYCISRELMEVGRAKFSNLLELCRSIPLPNDMAIGHIVNKQLGVRQRSDEHFNSHYEDSNRLPQEEIPNQVSFGFNTKKRNEAIKRFPKIPILYPAEEDPMLFQSLRAYLLHRKETAV